MNVEFNRFLLTLQEFGKILFGKKKKKKKTTAATKTKIDQRFCRKEREREKKVQKYKKKNQKKSERKICKYDSNKIEHNKTVKLPQALSVVKIFNTPLSPFLTLLLTDVLFFTPSLPSTPPIKKRKPGVFRSVESLGQEWGLSLVWNRSRGQAGVDSQSLCKVWGRCPCNPPTPRLVGFPLSLFVLPLGKKKKKNSHKKPEKNPKTPPNPPCSVALGFPPPPLGPTR